MIRRQLGSSDLVITTVGLGCFAHGGFMWGAQDDDDSVAAVHAAVGAGVNWVDTAPLYGSGRSEEVLGRALKDIPVDERPMVFTKFGHDVIDGERVKYGKREQVIADCEVGLKRLGVETIDLFQLHWPTPDPMAETAAAVKELIDAGKVRYAGVSNFSVEQCAEWQQHCPLTSVQNYYSLFRRDDEEHLLPWCAHNGVGYLAYSPLHRGLLFGNWGPDKTFPPGDHRSERPDFVGERLQLNLRTVGKLKEVAEAFELTMPQLAIGALISSEGMAGAIVGARNAEQAKGLEDLGSPQRTDVLKKVTGILWEHEKELAELG